MIAFVLILGVLVGFFLAEMLSGRREHEQGIIHSIAWDTKKYNIHIHHWIIALLALLVLVLLDYYNDVVYGLLLGILIQGLTYGDFYKVIRLR